MAALRELESDPGWLPHAIDPARRIVSFARIEAPALGSGAFLANLGEKSPAAEASFDAVRAMAPQQARLHFIFHSGFCRSTLLIRALHQPHVITGLNEPGILNSMAKSPPIDQALTDALLGLLARPHHPGESVVVKASNFPNALIPRLLQSRPDAVALLMTNTLEEFLEAVVRKGLAGRQWGRQVYFGAAGYVPDVFDLDDRALAGLTDLQLAAMAWLLTQCWFHRIASASDEGRVPVLQSRPFDAERHRTLQAVSKTMDLGLAEDRIAAIVSGPAFANDAKTGVDYAAKSAHDKARSHSRVTEEEIAEVCRATRHNAQLLRLEVPIPQTLFAPRPSRKNGDHSVA